jgi:hypothetical protein
MSRWRGRGAAMRLATFAMDPEAEINHTTKTAPQMWRNYNCVSLQLVVFVGGQ